MERFTSEHPEVVVEVRSRMDLGDGRTLMEACLRSPEPGPWVNAIRELPGVSQVEVLGEPGQFTLLRVVHRHSPFLPMFRRFQLMHRFPFPVERGVATWVMVGPEVRVRRFLTMLRRTVPGAVIESIRHDDVEGEAVLTLRQRTILRSALAAGYFEVPRRITLTNLAKELGMAISSLSEALAIIEKKLLAERHEA